MDEDMDEVRLPWVTLCAAVGLPSRVQKQSCQALLKHRGVLPIPNGQSESRPAHT